MTSTSLNFHTLLRLDYSEIPLANEQHDIIHKEFYELGFIDKQEDSISEIEFNIEKNEKKSKRSSIWHFINLDKNIGIALNNKFFVIQTTKYIEFERFEEDFKKCLSVLTKNFTSILVNELNLRSLNNLCSDSLEHIQSKNSILTSLIKNKVSENGYEKQHSMFEIVQVNNNEKFLVSRLVLSHVEGSNPLVPQDMVPFISKLTLNDNFKNLTGLRSTLDINCHYPKIRMNASTSSNELFRTINTMNDDLKIVFNEILEV